MNCLMRCAFAVSAGDPESKQLLDAFFLGRALAETVTERFGNLVGEILSEVGQRQAESQRHIREFQVISFHCSVYFKWLQSRNDILVRKCT